MLFYKSESKIAPEWMHKPHQRDCTHFYLYCDHVPDAWPNDKAKWQPMADEPGVEYLLLGDFMPELRDTFEVNNIIYIKTPCGSSVPVYPEMDGVGVLY